MGKNDKKDKNKPDPREYSWGYKKPEELNLTKCEKFKRGLYNSEEGTILGRTAAAWGKLGLFYLVMYIVTALLFAICMKGLLMTLNAHSPKWILEESLIGTNPGMGFRPMPLGSEDGSSIVWYQAKNATNVQTWVDTIKDFLKPYTNPDEADRRSRRICYFGMPTDGKACDVPVATDEWGDCREPSSFGFKSSTPCIFLKLNRIFGWTPEFYNDTKDLPEEMPDDLKKHIATATNKNYIWVSCEGDGPADNETLGPMEFVPAPGFPGYYYPYTNQLGYLSPILAVRFKRPAVSKLINVECRAWAKNIKYQRQTGAKDRMGSVHFEILVDP